MSMDASIAAADANGLKRRYVMPLTCARVTPASTGPTSQVRQRWRWRNRPFTLEDSPESKSDSQERFIGLVSPESSRHPNRLLSQICRPSGDPFYQGAFGEAVFTAAGFEGWLLIGGEDELPAPKRRTAATLKQTKANTANQGHRVV